MSGLQVPERYLMPDAVGAWLTGRVAALIYSRTDLGRLRTELRGVDPEVDAQLMALHLAALRWRTSATGSEAAPEPEVPPSSSTPWVSTSEAADLLGITDRAVRLACKAGAMGARRVGDRWRISREAVKQYRAARASRAA